MTAVSAQVTVAFARGASLSSCRINLEGGELASVEAALACLADLGHVAAFRVGPASPAEPFAAFTDRLRDRLGDMIVGAALASAAAQRPKPAYLMPVWPFDHEIGGMPASSGRLLGLDLAFEAIPSRDEEIGIALDGRPGLWLVRARPLPT